jgi:hypothetical protein
MPIEVGTHRNGERFAKVWLSECGISATIEGTGPDDDTATEQLEYRLRQLSEMAQDAADAMQIDEAGAKGDGA